MEQEVNTLNEVVVKDTLDSLINVEIKGAVNSKADIFLIPKDNYEEALELKQKNNYKIEIISIETIDQALEYLNQLEMK